MAGAAALVIFVTAGVVAAFRKWWKCSRRLRPLVILLLIAGVAFVKIGYVLYGSGYVLLAFLQAGSVASVALMAVVTWELARTALIDALTIATAAISFGLLLRCRVNAGWLEGRACEARAGCEPAPRPMSITAAAGS